MQALLNLGSAEWLLTRFHCANGSGVIVFRTSWVGGRIYVTVLATRNLVGPTRTWQFDSDELRRQIVETLPMLGALMAASYAAFYARFASQWSYVASLYTI